MRRAAERPHRRQLGNPERQSTSTPAAGSHLGNPTAPVPDSQRHGPDLQPRARGLPRRGPGLAGSARPRRPPPLPRYAPTASRQHRALGAHHVRGPLVRRQLARRVRRTGRRDLRVARLRGGVLPRPRPQARQPERHLPAGTDHARVRHRGAEGALPSAHGRRRRDLVPGLVRARCRQRPRRHPLARATQHGRTAIGSSTGRRPGPAGARSPTGASASSAPTPRRSATAGSTYFLVAMDSPGVTVRPIPQIDGETGFRRDLLRQRRGARGPGSGRGRRGLVRRHGDCRLRTRTLAAQPGALYRGGRPPPSALRLARRPGPLSPTPWRRPTWTPRPTSCTPTGRRPRSPAGTPSGPRRAATRSSGPRPTSPSTLRRSTCSGPTPSSCEAGAPGEWLDGYLFSLAGPIYAGTNEIQRNVVAERLLGLPAAEPGDRGLRLLRRAARAAPGRAHRPRRRVRSRRSPRLRVGRRGRPGRTVARTAGAFLPSSVRPPSSCRRPPTGSA